MAVDAKLEALRKRQREIAARIAAVESSQKARARKEDTRLKVLVGAAILADVARNPETRAGVEAVLQRAITAERDREFLKLKNWL
jgi:hypothetical protein